LAAVGPAGRAALLKTDPPVAAAVAAGPGAGGAVGVPGPGALAAPAADPGARTYIRTPSGGLHVYFTGSHQRNGHLPDCHLDFRSAGGYILTPPSQVGGRPYQLIQILRERGGLDWQAVIRLLEPGRQHQRPAPRQLPEHAISRLAGWVAAQPEGNRNTGLFWAANRALEADPAADLSPLATAARQAGLSEPEITRTLDSARRTSQVRSKATDHQAEGAS
jgi:hypothetical protein